jgi:SAM-dependent methyltransferase
VRHEDPAWPGRVAAVVEALVGKRGLRSRGARKEREMTTEEQLSPMFYELFEPLPRQGPGDEASTLRALSLLPTLPATARVLDVGCGAGTQTLVLAAHTPARLTAVDNHASFVEELRRRAEARGLADRIDARVGDMGNLGFPDASFDVVWSEGAIFVIGFERGLREWRRLLVPGGHLVVSDACLWTPSPSPECAAFLGDECPGIRTAEAVADSVAGCGYDLVGRFRLPGAAWWEDYYTPLIASVARLRARHPGNAEAEGLAGMMEREMDIHRRLGGEYGYDFFVMRRR